MKEMKVNVGDVCKVINCWAVYVKYHKFARMAGHPDLISENYIKYGKTGIVSDKTVRVLYIGQHHRLFDKTIAVVETIDSEVYLKFMISIDGLELTNEKSPINLTEYLSGKPLTEIIDDYYISQSFIDAIIDRNPMDLQYLSFTVLIDVLKASDYERVLRLDGGLLGLLPESRRTLELCRIAIENEPYAKRFVPKYLKGFV